MAILAPISDNLAIFRTVPHCMAFQEPATTEIRAKISRDLLVPASMWWFAGTSYVP